jgi:hypothetical protein
VADAILYEGYLLYPYRRSSAKNRVRWQFGVLAPEPWLAARGAVDTTSLAGSVEANFAQTECLLLDGERAQLRVRVRFLQQQDKIVERRTDAGWQPAEVLAVDDVVQLPFTEAIPHEHEVTVSVAELLGAGVQRSIEIPGGEEVTPVGAAGRIVRRREPISARLQPAAEPVPSCRPLIRLTVRVENAVSDLPSDSLRDQALSRCLLATHLVLDVDHGRFLSVADPPEWAVAATRQCRNIHTFPVLAGPEGNGRIVLSAPIILPDHPQLAPESPQQLHDSCEIDEILSLRTLTLSEAEKAEARATDARAAAIIDNVEAMPAEMAERLHGVIRSMHRTTSTAHSGEQIPWWEPGGDAGLCPETDVVLVDGVPLTRGSRVRLRPRGRGTDAQDMFLAGRLARVDRVLLDVDGSRHVAVTIEGDPAADLEFAYLRHRHFAPEEIEPLTQDRLETAP